MVKASGEVHVPVATEEGDNVDAAEQSKKQKTDSPSSSHRSADQAEAAAQPCRTQ
jgi:hypothetical protein